MLSGRTGGEDQHPSLQQCDFLCQPSGDIEAQEKLARLHGIVPLLQLEAASHELIRTRRCRACRTVSAAMARMLAGGIPLTLYLSLSPSYVCVYVHACMRACECDRMCVGAFVITALASDCCQARHL